MSKETARDRYTRETGYEPLYDDDRGATQFSYDYAKWLEDLVEDNEVLDIVVCCPLCKSDNTTVESDGIWCNGCDEWTSTKE
tara:strand:- start:2035 stop:2280 length:246 start_codon:yes stop_codon:yes gene_type:complete